MNERFLFCSDSVFQLFNAIVIKKTMYPNVPSDLVLTDYTDFSSILPALSEVGLFENIVCVEVFDKSRAFNTLDASEKAAILEESESYFPFPTDADYTDFFVPIDHIHWKLIYYTKLAQGKKINLHLYEEGLRTYTRDIFATEKAESYLPYYCKENPFTSAITEVLVYNPELFALDKTDLPITKIEKINRSNKELTDIIAAVFPCSKLPEEKFIFFEEAYIGDNNAANDMELFEEIANTVGKENIIVKFHPRNKTDRFTPKGYKVMPEWHTPWETQLALNDVSDKIFITISSTASVTPFLIFGDRMLAIHLVRRFVGASPLQMDKAFEQCYRNIVNLCNKDGLCIYRPSTHEETVEIINYYNRKGD